VNVYFSAARFSSIGERRRVVQGDKRSSEFEANACKVFERVVMMDQLTGSQVDIFVHVQQDDGSLESVALTAMSLALIDAGVPLKDLLVSCSSGFYDSVAFVDLNQQESNHSQVLSEYKVAILPRTGRIAYISYDNVGGHKLSSEVLRTVTQTAVQGCSAVHAFISQRLLSS
jgi:exosome complex component RRP41